MPLLRGRGWSSVSVATAAILSGAPAKLRVFLVDDCSPTTASEISRGGYPGPQEIVHLADRCALGTRVRRNFLGRFYPGPPRNCASSWSVTARRPRRAKFRGVVIRGPQEIVHLADRCALGTRVRRNFLGRFYPGPGS